MRAPRFYDPREDQPYRWQQVWELAQKGYTPEETAEKLGIVVSSVRQHLSKLSRWRNYNLRGRVEVAEAMASVYPDADRQNWIRWQMGLEERKRF